MPTTLRLQLINIPKYSEIVKATYASPNEGFFLKCMTFPFEKSFGEIFPVVASQSVFFHALADGFTKR